MMPSGKDPVALQKSAARFLFLDALRGIAAIAVMCHHLLHNTVMETPLRKILPGVIQAFCAYGAYGVEIFFIISGFVIAHSLRNNGGAAREAGRFILRRHARLDPPYWISLAFILLMTWIEGILHGLGAKAMPGGGAITLNFFYLQNLSGAVPVSGIAWTLCLEVQFYLVFILLLACGRGANPLAAERRITPVTLLLVCGLGLVSLICSLRQDFDFCFVPFWFYFAAGALTCWVVTKRVHPAVFGSFIGICAAAALAPLHPPMIVGVVTALLLFWAGKKGRLTDWLGHSLFQYFGRISYSLYLIHLPVLSIIMRAGYKLTHVNRVAALGWCGLAAICCILAAHVMHLLIEAPSMALAARLKKPGAFGRIPRWKHGAEGWVRVEESVPL